MRHCEVEKLLYLGVVGMYLRLTSIDLFSELVAGDLS